MKIKAKRPIFGTALGYFFQPSLFSRRLKSVSSEEWSFIDSDTQRLPCDLSPPFIVPCPTRWVVAARMMIIGSGNFQKQWILGDLTEYFVPRPAEAIQQSLLISCKCLQLSVQNGHFLLCPFTILWKKAMVQTKSPVR